MELDQDPTAIKRRMAQLEREIVRLSQEIDQRKAAGEETRSLELKLDRWLLGLGPEAGLRGAESARPETGGGPAASSTVGAVRNVS